MGSSLHVSTMVELQCGVTPRGAYFGNLPDFLALGAIVVWTYLVPPCHLPKKISSPLIGIATAWRYYSRCPLLLHYRNVPAFLAADDPCLPMFSGILSRPDSCGRGRPAQLLPLMSPQILGWLRSHRIHHWFWWVYHFVVSIPWKKCPHALLCAPVSNR